VSEQTVQEMAAGALVRSQAHVVLAVSGVAGPTGGTPQKPVGTVCFAWGTKGREVHCLTRRLSGDRFGVRRQSVIDALEGVLRVLGEP
jgi:nicotinamide-nucleotide amidase